MRIVPNEATAEPVSESTQTSSVPEWIIEQISSVNDSVSVI